MNTLSAWETPVTDTMSNAWRRYCLVKALECRRLGNEWAEVKRQALLSARIEKELMRYRREKKDAK